MLRWATIEFLLITYGTERNGETVFRKPRRTKCIGNETDIEGRFLLQNQEAGGGRLILLFYMYVLKKGGPDGAFFGKIFGHHLWKEESNEQSQLTTTWGTKETAVEMKKLVLLLLLLLFPVVLFYKTGGLYIPRASFLIEFPTTVYRCERRDCLTRLSSFSPSNLMKTFSTMQQPKDSVKNDCLDGEPVRHHN